MGKHGGKFFALYILVFIVVIPFFPVSYKSFLLYSCNAVLVEILRVFRILCGLLYYISIMINPLLAAFTDF